MLKLFKECYLGSNRILSDFLHIMMIFVIYLVVFTSNENNSYVTKLYLTLITVILLMTLILRMSITFHVVTEYKYPFIKILFKHENETTIFVRDLIINSLILDKTAKLTILSSLTEYSIIKNHDLQGTNVEILVNEYKKVMHNTEFSVEINKITQKEIELAIYNNLDIAKDSVQLNLQHNT